MSKKTSAAKPKPPKPAAAEASTKATVAATSPRAGRGAKRGKKAPSAKPPRQPRPPRPPRASALNAAATVLAEATKPMSASDLITAMESHKLWKSPGGKTPEATLSAAIGREIKTKGAASRFRKADRGLFESGPKKAD